jgi:hypothetical protein
VRNLNEASFHRLELAQTFPMMDWTDRHSRAFYRLCEALRSRTTSPPQMSTANEYRYRWLRVSQPTEDLWSANPRGVDAQACCSGCSD